MNAANRLRWRQVMVPVMPGVMIATVAGVLGYPYWLHHPAQAAVSVLLVASLGASGAVLFTSVESRATGMMILVSALLLAMMWASARSVGPWPMIGEFSQAFFFTTLSYAVFGYGSGAVSLSERIWIGYANITLILGLVVTMSAGRPEQLGYGPGALWVPTEFWPIGSTPKLLIVDWCYALLAGSFAVLMLRRVILVRGLDRLRELPMFFGIISVAVFSAGLQTFVMRTDVTHTQLMDVRFWQGVAAAAVPVAVMAMSLRGKWKEMSAASVVVSLSADGGLKPLERALRLVLMDEFVEVFLWVPGPDMYFSADHERRLPARSLVDDIDLGRVLYEVTEPHGGPLAVVTLNEGWPRHRALVTQALRGAGPALRAAQFDAVHVEQLREIQGRIMEAEQQGRRVVARDLHDGVQQHLLALSMELRRLERIPEGPDREAQLSDCVARAEGISEEVRRISRGVYPQLLAESGLASALEEDAEHLGRRVLLQVPATRLPARIELALYYVISEAITNADKHSGASTISVTVIPGPFAVRAVIRDDGVGGAVVHTGGGLHGIDDRVRAMGGRMNLSEARGGGTLLTVVLPAEGADDASSDR